MPAIEEEIRALELELGLMEDAVLEAKLRISGDDPEWEKRKTKTLKNMCSLVLQYKMEDPPHKAVAILSRMFADAREIAQQPHLVQQFDEKTKRLHTLRGKEESRQKALKEIGRIKDGQSWRATA